MSLAPATLPAFRLAVVRRPAPGWSPVWLAAPLLAASALLGAPAATLVALVAIIGLGVPHGALDGEVARDLLRPRFGRLWFPVFSLPYLGLCALVLLGWHAAPLATLAGFLAASVWHFGSEEADGAAVLEQVVRGGLPVAAPSLMHPSATAQLFATVTGVPMAALPAWWQAGAIAWLGLALVLLVRCALGRRRPDLLLADLLRPALLLAGFAILPPLTAFAIYFVCVHAPAHTRALIANDRRGHRVVDRGSALVRALPLTVLTLLLGMALWPLYDGPLPGHLLALTLQGLAALTLPHMLLEGWCERREARAPSGQPGPSGLSIGPVRHPTTKTREGLSGSERA